MIKICGLCHNSAMFGTKFAPMCKKYTHLKIDNICVDCAEKQTEIINNKSKRFSGIESVSYATPQQKYSE
jgi:hypothetical protein